MAVALLSLSVLVFLIRWGAALAHPAAALSSLIPVRDQGLAASLVQLGTEAVAVLVAAGAILGLARAGRAAAQWTGVRARGGERAVLSTAVGFAAASAALLGAALAGLVFPQVAAAVVAVCVIAGFASGTSRGWARAAATAAPGAAAAAAILLAFALVPESEIDALVYHLAFPRACAESHRLVLAPGSFLDGYWLGQEMLSWPAIALGSEAGAKLLSWAAALMIAGAGGVLAARVAGWASARWTAVLLLVAPPVAEAAVHAKNDALAAALVAAALVARTGGAGPARGLLAGLLVGSAAAVRPAAAIAGPALLATFVAARGGARAAVLAVAGCAAPAAPWAVRNWVELGNPLFPLLIGVLPTLGLAPLDRILADRYLREWPNANPAGIWQAAASFISVFGGAAPAAVAGLIAAPPSAVGTGVRSVLSIFALAFGACWLAVFPWLGRFALPAVIPLAVLGVRAVSSGPRRLAMLGGASVVLGVAVLAGLGAGLPGPAGCALGLESREGFARRAWGNWWEAGREMDRLVPAGSRAVAVGEWRAYPTRRVLTRWISDEPPVHEFARTSGGPARLRARLRQRRVTHLLHNLPQSNYWARYAARYPWEPGPAARWRDWWDSSATLVWRSPVQDPVHGFFLLYRLSRRPGEPPARGWLPGTEGECEELRADVSRSAADSGADLDLARAEALLGRRADLLARRGDLLAVRGRWAEALAAMRAANRAAPEARDVWAALGAQRIADPAALARFTAHSRGVVNLGFTLGFPAALSPLY